MVCALATRGGAAASRLVAQHSSFTRRLSAAHFQRPKSCAIWEPNQAGRPGTASAALSGGTWPRSSVNTGRKPSFRPQSTAGGGGGRSDGGGGGGGGGSGGGGQAGGGGAAAAGIAGLWAAYLKSLETNPVATKSISSALLNGFGDVMSQVFIEEHPFDWQRLLKFTSIGLVLVGPVLHYWYLTLSKVVTLQGTAGTLLRLALDQLAFAPTFIAAFFSTLCCFEFNPGKIQPMLKQEWWPAVITNWQLWVPFQFVNFRLVPQNLQVLFANMVALIWNTYLSFAGHRKLEEVPEGPAAKKQ
mmetsp:Transcript_43130/g.111820  ORF Transcript_43130/g.111820 Transcript_43130/m.111820 type:complete len:300 (-) Transcript_43130:234-1133(-)